MQQKTFDLNSLNGTNGFTVPGGLLNWLGFSVSTAGDINGDGLSDIVLGANYANSQTGACYIVFGSRGVFPSSFNLNNLNGINGFTVPGVAAYGNLGRSVSTAGDINGDGISDLVLGANGANSNIGASYVIFGSRGVFPSSFNLNNLNGTNGFIVPGIAASGRLGTSVSTAGDVNGDGISDLVLGASNAASAAGASYVIFGSRGVFPSSFNLNNLNGTNGFIVPGIAASGQLGTSVSTAGDINGDGISDLILGAPGANSGNGAGYLIFGSRGAFPASFNLTNLNGVNGFTVSGIAAGNRLGESVSTAGDINGDGISDLILGAVNAASVAGASYVIFGNRGIVPSSFNLNNLNGTNGFTVPGIVTSGQLGQSVSTAGDTNGDGISDLILGAYGVNSNTGASYIIFGSRGVFSSSVNLNNLNGSNGFTVPGIAASGYLGYSASTAGDMNGDGVSDLILGAPALSNNNIAAASYVIFGTFPIALLNNQMTLTEGQTLLLTNTQLNAMDRNNPVANLVFIPSKVQGGRFELVSNPGISLTTFTQQQITNNQIRFVSDRTAIVSYAVSVTNGQFTLPPVSANVTFTNYPPIVLAPPLAQVVQVNLPFNFTLQADQIFNDSDHDPLTYFAKLSNGSSLPNWIQFDATQANQLGFTGTAPSLGSTQLNLFARDPLNATANTPFEILTKSIWVNNQMTINQGQNLLLSNNTLDATGLNDPVASIVFVVSSVQGGQFELVSNQGTSVATFTQQQINTNQVRFVSNRTAPVAYKVSVSNGQFTLPPISANVTFINHAPEVVSMPATQLVAPNKPFRFSLQADQIFNDIDGDPLVYTATLRGGSAPLPNWMYFDASQPNQFSFSGTAPTLGGTVVSLSAQDPLNLTVKTEFEVLAQLGGNGTADGVLGTSSAAVTGSAVAGGILGFAAVLGVGLGFWRYTTNKGSRQGEHFANYIRESLNLKGVDNFETNETGQQYVAFVHALTQGLKESGINTKAMRPGELRELANDVAAAARDIITPATDCLGRTLITVDDLNNRTQDLVAKVQILRNSTAARDRGYTV